MLAVDDRRLVGKPLAAFIAERRRRDFRALVLELSHGGAFQELLLEELTDGPRLVFFHARNSCRSRRVEGYLSQVLQRRRNHESFRLHHIDVDEHAELAKRFGVRDVPTIVVVEGKRVRGRLASPRGCRDIEQLLAPWLR